MHPPESSPTHTRKSPRSSNWQFTCQEGAVELCHLGHAHGVWVRDSAAGDRSIISVGHQYGQEAVCSGAFAMKATRAHERAVDMRLHCPRPYSPADLCERSMLRACSGLNTKPRCRPSNRALLLCAGHQKFSTKHRELVDKFRCFVVGQGWKSCVFQVIYSVQHRRQNDGVHGTKVYWVQIL